MADFFPLIDRTILGLDEPTAENRAAVYARARTELRRQSRGSGAQAERDAASLDVAILLVEEKFATAPIWTTGGQTAEDDPALSGETPGLNAIGAPPRGRGSRQFAFNTAASWMVNVLKALLQLVLLPIMARLLDPTAYGIYSLAFPTVMFFLIIADGGLGASLSREDESNRVLWSTASWLLLMVCGAIAVVVGSSGVVLAWMSGQPSLKGIMVLLALVPLIMAISIPADARLVRRGNLLYHSGGDLAASIVGAAVALSLAYEGFGAWALAAQYVANFSVRAAILNAGAWSLPDRVFDLSSLRGHVSTGGALLTSRVSELVGKFAENALFSHIFGTGQLGSYTLANQVARYMCDAVTNPLVGAFYAHALHASDRDASSLYVRLVRIILCTLLPATVMASITAAYAFPLILGAKWIEAAPMLRAVVVSYALLGTAALCPQILLKHGLYERSAKVLVASAILRVAAVAAGFAGFSAVTVTWLVGASLAIQALALVSAVPTRIGARWQDLARAAFPPVAAAAVSGCAASLALLIVPTDLVAIVAVGVSCSALYAALLFVFGGHALRRDLSGLRQALRRP